jgi:hypothetical protein
VFEDRDLYAATYVERLWALLPGIYRSMDAMADGSVGPLRELVVRVGTEIAVLRRGIDRTLENQSIEGCDDWLIPYIGDILSTHLVAGLGGRAQRLDVAKTIYYRRRKGTLAILEELAADITGWNARAVEFFTRLGRTRHQYDPAIGTDHDGAVIAGLLGTRSHTPRGGFADLRHAAAAHDAASAFDEFAHTADMRRGAQRSGWHNIPKLGVFLWRLRSFACDLTTPVEHALCPGQYTFDPTGREIQLFAADTRDAAQYGDAWVTPDEWMLPTPIGTELLGEDAADLYASAQDPKSLSALSAAGGLVDLLAFDAVEIHPERGRLQLETALPAGAVPRVRYHYGFSSQIGAAPYDRRALGETLPPQPAPIAPDVVGGGPVLAVGLAGVQAGTLTIRDSLTYDGPADLVGITDLLLRAAQDQRPVIRRNGGAWVLTGAGDTAQVTLEGLLLSGGDLILRGHFAAVELFCTTLDPGEAPGSTGTIPTSIDGRPLLPMTVWIEGQVGTLRLRRAITGPIRTRNAGKIARIEAADSIIQGVRMTGQGAFTAMEIFDPQHLARRFKTGMDPLTTALRSGFSTALQAALTAYYPTTPPDGALAGLLVTALADAVALNPLYTPARFAHLPLPAGLAAAALSAGTPAARQRVNRLLLESAYPVALSPAAIASAEAEVSLARTTCLGQVFADTLSVSETILAGFTRATNIQDGCVRFSAFADGSRLHQPYESVALRAPVSVFVSQRFGDPGYAQLSRLADHEIIAGGPGASVLAGAQNGAEMGVFARELNAVKERGLTLKLLEYMPVGVTPVLVFVT